MRIFSTGGVPEPWTHRPRMPMPSAFTPSTPSGRLWTGWAVGRRVSAVSATPLPPQRGASVRRFGGGLGRRLHAALGEHRFDLGGAKTQLAQDVGAVLADAGRMLLR